MTPNVSIIIPTYNRYQLLKDAVESCYTCTKGLKVEVIVVDDGSTGCRSTENVVTGSGAQYFRLSRNSGSSVARNYGKSVATGDYIKFLDSDDVLIDGSLSHEYNLGCKLNADIVVSGWRDSSYRKDTAEKCIL